MTKTGHGAPFTGTSLSLPWRGHQCDSKDQVGSHFPWLLPWPHCKNLHPSHVFTSASHFHLQQAWPIIHILWKQKGHWSKSQCSRHTLFCDTLEYKKKIPYLFNVLNHIKPLSCSALKRIKSSQIPESFHGLFLLPKSQKKLRAYTDQRFGEGPWSCPHRSSDTHELLVAKSHGMFFSLHLIQTTSRIWYGWFLPFPPKKFFPSLTCPISSLAAPSQWLCWFLLIFSNPKKFRYYRPSPLDHLSIFTLCGLCGPMALNTINLHR